VRAHADRARRLDEAGQTAEAASAWHDCVRLCRELSTAEPGTYRPYLAEALGHEARLLAATDRSADALAAADESTEIWHELALDDPAAHLPAYAGASSNLALMLAEAGRAEDALPHADRAVRLYRGLDQPGLAVALTNRGLVLNRLDRFEEARAALLEALKIYRELVAQDDPYEGLLAMSLHNLSIATVACGDRETALELNVISVQAYEELASQDPDTYQDRLAAARTDLALLRAEMGAPPPTA
jgi:tetratricopeptide (TPR) repeat protein